MKCLTREAVSALSTTFQSQPRNLLARNATARASIKQVALNRTREVELTPQIFSHKIPKEANVTSQGSTGRCWIFAALNTIRVPFMEEHGLEKFEFSQGYLFFWDKLEKANYFLENITDLLDLKTGDRLLDFLLKAPMQDGGQWDMVAALINKYGLVPKEAYPDTHAGSASAPMRRLLTTRLRQAAGDIRAAHSAGESKEALGKLKEQTLRDCYQILSICLGEPPQTFDWAFYSKDKDKKDNPHTVYRGLTPQTFMSEHVGIDITSYVSIVHDPRNPYNKCYTVDRLGNVVGGQPVLYLNLDMPTLKQLARKRLVGGKPVWFGVDMGKYSTRDSGLMDPALFDYELLFDIKLNQSKADRLRYGESLMTHAMVFTGIDIDERTDEIVKFRVENSWGEKRGNKGYFCMSSEWADEFLYQICVEKSELLPEQLAALEGEPTVLPAWDPLGSLAL